MSAYKKFEPGFAFPDWGSPPATSATFATFGEESSGLAKEAAPLPDLGNRPAEKSKFPWEGSENFTPEIIVEQPSHLFPQKGDFTFLHPVSEDAVEKVGRIREEALARGWTKERLYQNRGRIRFPCGPDWGLVCFLEADDQIGKITPVAIEIIHHKARITTSRFFRDPRTYT